MVHSNLLTEQNTDSQSSELIVRQRPEVSTIFRALADDKSLTLFNTVALNPGNRIELTSNLGVTLKQYYSRMVHLSSQGLVARKNGRYYLTTLGKILYELQNVIGIAVNDYWKLKAIDSLRIQNQVPEDQLAKFVDSMVENQGLRNMILKK